MGHLSPPGPPEASAPAEKPSGLIPLDRLRGPVRKERLLPRSCGQRTVRRHDDPRRNAHDRCPPLPTGRNVPASKAPACKLRLAPRDVSVPPTTRHRSSRRTAAGTPARQHRPRVQLDTRPAIRTIPTFCLPHLRPSATGPVRLARMRIQPSSSLQWYLAI